MLAVRNIGELRRKLREVGYREKAIKEILRWYS
jgi:SOS response regulatory protein OraA/RecX